MIKISKELISAVLGNEVPYEIKIHKIIIKNNILNYFYNSKDIRGGLFEANEYINIYELANKCKEWAFNKGYWLSIRLKCPDVINVVIFSHIHSQLQNELFEIDADIEPEAIIKACEWIYKEINK